MDKRDHETWQALTGLIDSFLSFELESREWLLLRVVEEI